MRPVIHVQQILHVVANVWAALLFISRPEKRLLKNK